MRIVMFYHSLVSCWNHGNAHFLRGLVRSLLRMGHQVDVYEPRNNWSLENLVAQEGLGALQEFQHLFPELSSHVYTLEQLDDAAMLESADLVLVHEWNDARVVARVGEHRKQNPSFRLLFHDTHHRMVSAPAQMRSYDLSHYDGVLAFGEVLTRLYLERGLAERAWTFHEAADASIFFPPAEELPKHGDLVWIGNWGDDERTEELQEFLFEPVRHLGLQALVHGVRYPEAAKAVLRRAGVKYAGWLPNHRAPAVFARFHVTVHVPRRLYRHQLPGIPTIRVFEALAAGIPLVSSPWSDSEGLFRAGHDYLVARNGREMERHLTALLGDAVLRDSLRRAGRRTILERHTCDHRASELLSIYAQLTAPGARREQPETAAANP
jgi:spore maturation protein CgeB